MSTAKSTAKTPALTAADFADILATTLAMAAEVGLSVAARKSEATAARPAGLLLFVEGLSATDDGRIVAIADEPEAVQP